MTTTTSIVITITQEGGISKDKTFFELLKRFNISEVISKNVLSNR